MSKHVFSDLLVLETRGDNHSAHPRKSFDHEFIQGHQRHRKHECRVIIYKNDVEVFLKNSLKAIAANRRSVSAQGVASRELPATKHLSYDAS